MAARPLEGRCALITGSTRGLGLAIANLIAFLCSPGGNEINGAAIPIDGAWMAS